MKITLTDEHIKLIRNLLIEDEDDYNIRISCFYKISGGKLLDDLSLILGFRDKAIKNSEEDSDGRAFPDDIEKYMLDLHKYVQENLMYIEEIVHDYGIVNGLTSGTYEKNKETLIWEKIN